MTKTVCIMQGHPHAGSGHFCDALAGAYEEGAKGAGFKMKRLVLADTGISFLHDPGDFPKRPDREIVEAQNTIRTADHLFIIYPLWLGTMPAFVKAFFEQLSRNEFALSTNENGGWPRKMLKDKSARVVVTMGMPSAAYKLFFGAHGVKGFESATLGMSGFNPIRDTFIGGVGGLSPKQSERHLSRMRVYGACGE